MSRLIITIAGLFALSGCYKIDYVNGPKTGPEQTIWHHRVALGIVELPGPIKLNELCPTGFAAAHTEISFLNGLVTNVLGNIIPSGAALYNPSTVQVWCNSGAAYDATLDDEGMVVEAALIPGAMPAEAPLEGDG